MNKSKWDASKQPVLRIMWAVVLCLLIDMASTDRAQAQKRRWNPETLFNSEEFSHLTKSETIVKTVYISSQSAATAAEGITASMSLREQTKRTLDNLGVALRAAGATPEDVVSLHIYVINHQGAKALTIARLVKLFFHESMPTSSFIPVQWLATPNASIEIDAIAEVDARESQSAAGGAAVGTQ